MTAINTLARRAQTGDAQAFSDLYDATFGMVRGLCYTLSGSGPLAAGKSFRCFADAASSPVGSTDLPTIM